MCSLYKDAFKLLIQLREAESGKRNFEIKPTMAKLLFVLLSFCVYYRMSFADTKCTRAGPPANTASACSDDDDKNIMNCCLKSYKLGFDTLGSRSNTNRNPPSCGLDLGLAQCLDQSKCFGKPLTNGLRRLIFNQLVFTERVGLCNNSNYEHILKKAEEKSAADFLKELEDIKEMETMPQDKCAKEVYRECGRNFAVKLNENPGYNAIKLCKVFIAEGGCITEKAKNIPCESDILKRFKSNSGKAAYVILPVICSV